MTATVAGILLAGAAASRPAASAVSAGTLYSATDTGAITQSDGVSTWSAYATIPGSSSTPQYTSIEIGHASDTTLSRASAGVLQVEGNRLFAVGGTDVPIADGGTGASTAAAAATALGLGTGDSPQLTAINVGHASDTTLARVSAGVLSVEGNTIYAAGGTDVAVADGGTGSSTASAARTALGVAYSQLAGYELDYVERTTAINITNTGATPDTILTGSAVVYDGSTAIYVEFVADQIRPGSANGNDLNVFLYDGSTKLCYLGYILNNGSTGMSIPAHMRSHKITPSAASHTYSIRAAVSAGTGSVSAGAGTGGAEQPAYIRITRAAA